MGQSRCPFCDLERARVTLENGAASAFPDAFSVAEGHTLVVPRRHVASLFDLPEEEQAALWSLVALVRAKLMEELRPDGFNVGVNDGPAAGQTVMHAHVHVIPRRKGDVPDPRGGVRCVIPKRAAYWAGGHDSRPVPGMHRPNLSSTSRPNRAPAAESSPSGSPSVSGGKPSQGKQAPRSAWTHLVQFESGPIDGRKCSCCRNRHTRGRDERRRCLPGNR